MISIEAVDWNIKNPELVKKLVAELTNKHKTEESKIKNILNYASVSIEHQNTFKRLVLLSVEDLKKIKSICISPKTPREYKRYLTPDYFKFLSDLYTSFFKNSNRIDFAKSFNMNTCPYCNRNYINFREKENGDLKGDFQFDHIIDKGTYPILSVSLNNLIPVCQPCNHIKLQKQFDLSIFDFQMKQLRLKSEI